MCPGASADGAACARQGSYQNPLTGRLDDSVRGLLPSFTNLSHRLTALPKLFKPEGFRNKKQVDSGTPSVGLVSFTDRDAALFPSPFIE